MNYDYWELLIRFLAIIGALTVAIKFLEVLSKFFDSVAELFSKIKIYIYYPVLIRIRKKRHKDYVEEYFNNLIFRRPIELPAAIGRVKIKWSSEESVEVDLKEDLLLVRVEYSSKVEEVLAKVALLASPYIVSKYLEPALGEVFSRFISIGVIENMLQEYPAILTKYRELVEKIYGQSSEYREILGMITKADDTSLYSHVFLYELRKILSKFGARVDRDKLIQELKELMYMIANLENVDAPNICGYYVSLAIVRAGKLEKVAVELWEPYVKYINTALKQCPSLQHVFIVSAGGYISRAVEKLLKYIEEKVPNLRLIDRFEYKARYYKGKPNIPCLVAVMEFK